MMTGFGQFGPMEMGGMFTVVKVREGLAAGDYKDPGWYQNPPGTVAYEIENVSAQQAPRRAEAPGARPALELNVVKPGARPSSHRH
jgi:hypothetical protein